MLTIQGSSFREAEICRAFCTRPPRHQHVCTPHLPPSHQLLPPMSPKMYYNLKKCTLTFKAIFPLRTLQLMLPLPRPIWFHCAASDVFPWLRRPMSLPSSLPSSRHFALRLARSECGSRSAQRRNKSAATDARAPPRAWTLSCGPVHTREWQRVFQRRVH